jgi:hypothetical protein
MTMLVSVLHLYMPKMMLVTYTDLSSINECKNSTSLINDPDKLNVTVYIYMFKDRCVLMLVGYINKLCK